MEFLSRISRTKYSRGNGRLMINNNDDGDDVSSFSGSLFSFPIWFPIKMKVLLKEYLDSRCALIYPIVSSLDSRLELFKLFLRIGSILFSVSIQFGKRKKKFLHERKGWRPSRGNDFSPFVRFVRIHRLIWNSFYHSPGYGNAIDGDRGIYCVAVNFSFSFYRRRRYRHPFSLLKYYAG